MKLTPFDVADYLDEGEVVVEYLAAAMEDPNPDVFLAAIGDVAKARGVTGIIEETNLSRGSLSNALSAQSRPRYETIAAVLRTLSVKFRVTGKI